MKPSTAIYTSLVGALMCGFGLGMMAGEHEPWGQSKPHLSEPSLLHAISQVESGGHLAAEGKNGEFGEYQMSLPLWYQWFRENPGQYIEGQPEKTETAAALWHLHNLEVENQSFDVTVLSGAWHGHADADYEARVVELYNQYIIHE